MATNWRNRSIKNLRVLKKREKRAARELIKHHGYYKRDFSPSDGDESINAPRSLRSGKRRSWLNPGPMRGTPLVWCKVSYEYDEWDAKLPSEILWELEYDWTTESLELCA